MVRRTARAKSVVALILLTGVLMATPSDGVAAVGGVMTDLGTPPASPAFGSNARDLNNSNQVVGVAEYPGLGERAFLWTAAGGVTNLGTLGGDLGAGSGAVAINDTGLVAGTSFGTSSRDIQAFVWTEAGGMVNIGDAGGTLLTPRAIDVNDAGMVLGEAVSTSTGAGQAFVWTESGGMVGLGALGPVEIGSFSDPAGMSDNGHVVGWSNNFAFLWTEAGGMVRIDDTTGGTRATAVNDLGQVVGSNGWFASGAFLWAEATGMVEIPAPSGKTFHPAAITRNGLVVGDLYDSATNTQHAASWTAGGGMVDLGTLGGDGSWVTGVNEAGRIIGGSRTASGETHAFSWTAATEMVDMGTLGGTMVFANAVNEAGRAVGSSTTADDEPRAFIWTPTGGVWKCHGRVATLVGTSGDDVLVGTTGDDVIVGLGGNDRIYGRWGDDTLCGNAGWDKIYPGRGVDYVDGGIGSRDWVSYASAKRGVVVSLRTGVGAGQGRDTLVRVENIIGSGFDDKLIGNSRSNRIVGGGGADSIWGKFGNDFLWGNAGPDVLHGGEGSDVARGGPGVDTCTAEVRVSC